MSVPETSVAKHIWSFFRSPAEHKACQIKGNPAALKRLCAENQTLSDSADIWAENVAVCAELARRKFTAPDGQQPSIASLLKNFQNADGEVTKHQKAGLEQAQRRYEVKKTVNRAAAVGIVVGMGMLAAAIWVVKHQQLPRQLLACFPIGNLTVAASLYFWVQTNHGSETLVLLKEVNFESIPPDPAAPRWRYGAGR